MKTHTHALSKEQARHSVPDPSNSERTGLTHLTCPWVSQLCGEQPTEHYRLPEQLNSTPLYKAYIRHH